MNDLDKAYGRLERDGLVSAGNKELILKFGNVWLARGCTKIRVVKLVYCLRKLAANLNKPFADASKDDLIALVGRIEGDDLADSSKYDLKVILKMFYRWLKGDDENTPKEVAWIKPRLKNGRHKLPEEILTEKEVLDMAAAATNARDKALVLVLYESGCRIGELMSLHLKNVQFDQYGAVLRVTGKTGDRRVRIISSAPALSQWIENYGGEQTPDAMLWPPRSNRNRANDYAPAHRSVYKTVTTLAKRAGITKKVHPHLFRHSRATALANKLTEAQMKEFFGWTQGSEMASVYVHLSGRDVDNALLSLQGLAKRKDTEEETLQLCHCARCKEKNSPASKFCTRCGSPLSETTLTESFGQPNNGVLNELMQDSEVKQLITRKIVEKGLIDKMVF
ncbi:tyrosine-type recombinase/integrase [Candidatus Micrarchaeota archaeon]|nr:tyrosine-type recombinase/integrase [Candidatus Micrarchaeota archaeon]